MSKIYGSAIWIAIGVMLTGLSMLFGVWGVVAVAGGVGLAAAVLYTRK